MATKEKKKPKTALWLGLGFLVFAAVVLVFAYRYFFPSDDGRSKPLGGAKIKKEQIWSADGLTVTAEKIDAYYGGSWEREALYLKVKNEGSSPRALCCRALSVNGASVQPELELNAAPGAESSGMILFDRSSLYDMQITTVGTISLEFAAVDPASGAETARSGLLTIETNKVKKADPPKLYYEAKDVYQEDGIRIATADLSMVYTESSSAVRFYVENGTGQDIRIVPKDTKVNGSPYTAPFKRADGSPAVDMPGWQEGYTFPAGSKGTFYFELEYEPLDGILPLDNVTGILEIYDNAGGKLIREAEFTYQHH